MVLAFKIQIADHDVELIRKHLQDRGQSATDHDVEVFLAGCAEDGISATLFFMEGKRVAVDHNKGVASC